jgi:hypothetical protein
MEFIYDDGGRAAAGFKGIAGDCVVRAIAIASAQPYRAVYDDLNRAIREQRVAHVSRVIAGRASKGKLREAADSTARNGVFKSIFHPYLLTHGWRWTPTMKIGSGCKVHLRADELPTGRLIVAVSKHLTTVIDGVIHDLNDVSRDGTRCVYGYYIHEADQAIR